MSRCLVPVGDAALDGDPPLALCGPLANRCTLFGCCVCVIDAAIAEALIVGSDPPLAPPGTVDRR